MAACDQELGIAPHASQTTPAAIEPALWDLLRFAARPSCDGDDLARLAETAGRLTDWAPVAAEAEAHGLGPLLFAHLRAARVSVPAVVEHALAGSAMRCQLSNHVRFAALGGVLDAFDRAAVPALVLKGAALAHLIYDAGRRPLGDIDLLVEPRHAPAARHAMLALGFRPSLSPYRETAAHHHLPMLVRVDDGVTTKVEIHTSALSLDAPEVLSMATMTGPSAPIHIAGRAAETFGSVDMLRHLCRHAVECAPRLRLIWIADLVGYASRHADDLDWDALARTYPFVVNAIALAGAVAPFPARLAARVSPVDGRGMRGVGVVPQPLSDIFARGRSVADISTDVFDPSDWWLRFYYGVPAEAPLFWHRAAVHPSRVAYWLARRLVGRIRAHS